MRKKRDVVTVLSCVWPHLSAHGFETFEGLAQEVPDLRGDTYPFKDSIDEGNG